jgi:hypothetical protein
MDPNTSGKNIDSFLVTVGGTNRQTAASIEQAQEAILGSVLEPDTLILPDFEDAIPPANALGLSGGRLALGDGSTTGGNSLTPRRVAGSVVCDLDGTSKASARFAIVGIPLTAAEVVNAALVNITGTIRLLFDDTFYGAEDPVISATIGFVHNAYKTDATTKWLKYNSLPTGTELPYLIRHEIIGDFQFSLNAVPGPEKVVLIRRLPVVIAERWGGALGATFQKNSGAVQFADPTDTSVAVDENVAETIWLAVEIVMGASGTNLPITFGVAYDLDINVTLP